MKLKLLASNLAIILLLTGCASKQKENYDFIYGNPYINSSTNAQTKIAEAAVSVSDSLNQLAAIEKTIHPPEKLKSPLNPDCIHLGALASADWTGPVEPLVDKLAKAGQYKFRVVGNRPAIPVLVQIYDSNMPIYDILRDVNYQAAKKADILVYPSSRVIELRYRYS